MSTALQKSGDLTPLQNLGALTLGLIFGVGYGAVIQATSIAALSQLMWGHLPILLLVTLPWLCRRFLSAPLWLDLGDSRWASAAYWSNTITGGAIIGVTYYVWVTGTLLTIVFLLPTVYWMAKNNFVAGLARVRESEFGALSAPPLWIANRVLTFLLPRNMCKRVIEPLLADIEEEHYQALDAGHKSRAMWCLVLGYITIALCLVRLFSTGLLSIGAGRDDD